MRVTQKREEINARVRSAGRRLFLSNAFADFSETSGTLQQAEFLMRALEQEIELREENKRKRLLRRADFPAVKSFADYDYRHVTIPPAMTKAELEDAAFVAAKQNLVLYGPVGTGKTHMAIAAGREACKRGHKTRFYTVAELVLTLSGARRDGKLDRFLKELNSLELLILDEWGYVPIDRDGAQLLFRVIADSYEQKSLILTTNLEFSKWGSVFTDDQMTAAMIDRLVHHGHMFIFDGKSFRMEHALMGKNAEVKDSDVK
ncbi:MAG: IS21-like element helper ATPase IstB [Erysipelotrichaceae bacterium]|nr:IS21-like element helper ATPase IstB [Erysipelotrichaceae bacterium]